MGAADPSGVYEIVRAGFVDSDMSDCEGPTVSVYSDGFNETVGKEKWLVAASKALLPNITSEVWSLFIFVLVVIGFSVVFCMFCIIGIGGFTTEEFEYGKK